MHKILFILIIYNIIFSAPVTIYKANRVAENIIIERFVNSDITNFTISTSEIIKSNNIDLIYLFHIDPIGFVLVPADDRATPVLAYSYESDLIRQNMPGNLFYILNLYQSQILDAIETSQAVDDQILDLWTKYLSEDRLNDNPRNVDPLLTAKFDQGVGWNEYCPEDPQGPGGHALVGCVAVSMAQIMHYWSFPDIGLGSNGYQSPYGWLDVDFSSAYYDYSAMGDGTAYTDAAALLLYHAGVSIYMDYGYDWSGAWMDDASNSLQEHFLYQNNMYIIQDYNYNEEEFSNLLKNELDNYRPLIYSGDPEDGSGGHAWNIDGYQYDQFHMNWGWGGGSNGYFSLNTALGYTQYNWAIINIQPEDINEPKLFLGSYEFNETSGDMDMVLNPGDTFELYSTLFIPPIFNDADNIEIFLSTEETGINIINDSYFHGPLLSGGSFFNEYEPFIIQIDQDIALSKKTLLLEAIVDVNEVSYEYNYEIEILVSLNQYGFPVYSASQKTSPLIVDLDNDGDKEIIYGDYNGFVHIINSDGNEVVDDTFPFDTGNQIWGSAAAADMDGDGLTDFVITSKSKHLYIFDQNGLKTDYNANKYLMGTPAIGNLDGDEDLEVVVGGYSSPSSSNQIFAINPDGSDVDGFPIVLGEKTKAGVALADFNGNGKDDIVVGTDDGNMYLIYDDGTVAPGFPYTAGDKIQAAPSVAEVDGEKVIFFGSNDNSFYAINSDGSLRFTIETDNDILTSASFLDINENLYIFFGSNDNMMHAINANGDALNGWPVDAGAVISKSVVFSDLDNNGEAEVVAVTQMTDVLVYNLDGSSHDGFPMDNEFPFLAAPMVMDMDDDGDLEILASSVNSLVALDIKSLGNNDGYWSLYRGNNQRTGYVLYQFGVDEEDQSDIILEEGFNLISFHVIPEDSSVGNILSSLGDNAVSLLGEGVAATNTDNGWLGSLTHIEHDDGYWLLVNEEATLSLTGVPIQPDQNYALQEGFNLISYPFLDCGIIDEVLPDEIEDCTSAILGEGVAAVNSGNGWMGALQSLCPDDGYWFTSLCDIDLIFNEPASLARRQVLTPSPYPYNQSSLQAFYFIETVENIELGDWILAYNGEIVIGGRQWTGGIIDLPAMGNAGNSLTAGYIQSGSIPQFKLLKGDKLIELTGEVPVWSENQIYMVSSLTPLPESFNLSAAYPNPFNPTTTLSFALPVDSKISLSIYDLQGREVSRLISGNMEAGYHSVAWNADVHASGVYFVKMIAGEFVKTQKLMLIK